MANVQLQIPGGAIPLIPAIFIFFSPFLVLISNKKFLKFIRGMKSMSLVYLFTLFITFLIGRGIFLLMVGSSRNLFGLPTAVFEVTSFLSSISYWFITGKFIKSEKDMIGMITLMYGAEMFWFVIFYSLAAMALRNFIYY